MFGKTGEVERHTELATKLGSEAEVFARQVHGEVDVVAAVENHLALGLVHEAISRTLFDRFERLRQVESAAFGQHECLSHRYEIHEGQHVGDDLDDRCAAQRPHVQNGVSYGGEEIFVLLELGLVSADEHGDLTGRGPMHPAGDRCFEH